MKNTWKRDLERRKVENMFWLSWRTAGGSTGNDKRGMSEVRSGVGVSYRSCTLLVVAVTCLQCHAESNTFDPFLDISLDVKNVSSIARALERFAEPETLDTDNAYICTK